MPRKNMNLAKTWPHTVVRKPNRIKRIPELSLFRQIGRECLGHPNFKITYTVSNFEMTSHICKFQTISENRARKSIRNMHTKLFIPDWGCFRKLEWLARPVSKIAGSRDKMIIMRECEKIGHCCHLFSCESCKPSKLKAAWASTGFLRASSGNFGPRQMNKWSIRITGATLVNWCPQGGVFMKPVFCLHW